MGFRGSVTKMVLRIVLFMTSSALAMAFGINRSPHRLLTHRAGGIICSGYQDCKGDNLALSELVNCTGNQACNEATFSLLLGGTLDCDGYQACKTSSIQSSDPATTIICDGEQTCADAEFYISDGGCISCNGSQTCKASSIHCAGTCYHVCDGDACEDVDFSGSWLQRWHCGSGSVTNDPHLVSLGGDKFDVNQPADYVLLRAPLEDSQPALLELRGSMEPERIRPCGLYMNSATLSGAWFGEAIVQVRPLKRNKAGSNRAGTVTEWPFSMQVSPEGSWKSFADFTVENSSEALTDMVKIIAEKREEYGELLEGQAFTFHIGKTDRPATIIISQAAHQALNVEVFNMQALGHRTFGGLLGTEKHSKGVEKLTDECKAHRASEKALLISQKPLETSRMSASWL